MTPDRLRQLADAAAPGPWIVRDDKWDGPTVVSDWDGASYIVVAEDNSSRELIAALGPDAARLLADMADGTEALLEWAERYRGGDESLDPEEWYVVRDFARRGLKAFAALGENTPEPGCVCGEINTRHCPQHANTNEGQTTP